MTEGGLTGVYPKRDTVIIIKKHVERLSDAAYNALAKGLLFADKHVGGKLTDLISTGNEIRKHGDINEKLEPESEFAESVTRFNHLYYELLRMLREKSGVKLIEEVFESIPQERDADPEGEKKDKPNK